MIAAALSIDPLELVWIVTSLVGLWLAYGALADARRDGEIVERRHGRYTVSERERELERAVVDDDVVAARWSIAYMVAALAAGVASGLVPPPPAGRTPIGYVLVTLILFGLVAQVARLYVKRRRRRRLLEGA